MIVLDFETNSTNPRDVLEVGAYKIIWDNNTYKILDTFHRYYFSKYEVNYFALDVHNLSPEKIEKLRGGVEYPKYFEDDKDFIDFCKGTKVLVAHNVSFELRYLDNIVNFENIFCTMKENKIIVNAKNKNGNIKNPKLVEACNHYKIEFDYSKYHSALYDAEKALEILNSMNNLDNDFNIISYTLKEQKKVILEEKQKIIEKQKQKYLKALDIEKRKIEKEASLKNRECPNCHSNNVHKKGKRQRKGYQVQRYQCMDCKSIFQEKISNLNIETCSLSLEEIEKKAKENLLKQAVKKREEKIKQENERKTNLSNDINDKSAPQDLNKKEEIEKINNNDNDLRTYDEVKKKIFISNVQNNKKNIQKNSNNSNKKNTLIEKILGFLAKIK